MVSTADAISETIEIISDKLESLQNVQLFQLIYESIRYTRSYHIVK